MNSVGAELAARPVFVFDFYGTLVEDEVAVPAIWEELVRRGYSCSPTLQAMFEPDGFDGTLTPDARSTPSHDDWIRSNWRQLVRLSGVPAESLDELTTELLDGQSRYRARALPAAQPLLDLLRHHGRKVGLCSNWESPIGPFLAHAGLSGFDAISISSEVGARKPHIAMFDDIARKLSCVPHEVVFVGDNWSSDIVGALRAGFSPVWIRGSRESRDLAHMVPEFHTLGDFAQMVANCLSTGVETPWTLMSR